MVRFQNAIDSANGGTLTGTTAQFIISNDSNTASSSAVEILRVGGGTASDPYHLYEVTGGSSYTQGIDNSDSDSFVISANGTLGTSNAMRMTSAGEITYPLQPAFLAFVNTQIDNVTGDGTVYTIIYDTEVFDQNSDFNLGTSTFTAPITGRYQIDCKMRIGGGTAISAATGSLVTSNRTYRDDLRTPAGATSSAGCAYPILADMDAADTFTITVVSTDSGGKIDDITGSGSGATYNYISAYLAC